jgi:predicted Zn-dependent protease
MKKAVIIVVLGLVLGGLGLWLIGIPAYQRHQERRAAQQAVQLMARGDHRNASVSARRALQLNSRNLDACRVMADLNELSRSPAELDWRRRIVDTAPTVENKLQLAAAAMRFQGPPFTLAAQTLEEIGDSGRDVPAYHTIAGELAFKLNHLSEAAAHYEAASRLEPTNELHQLNLAVLRLESTNAQVVAASRTTLQRLSASPVFGTIALRWLVGDALRTNDLVNAELFARQLVANPHSALGDRLVYLNILRETKNAAAADYLAAVQKGAGTNALQAYEMSAWMISHGLVGRALPWLTNLISTVRDEQPAPQAVVDCYLATKDWSGLQIFLEGQKWGDLEFLRFANLSLAAEKQRQNLAADARWRSAVREAGDRLGSLANLRAFAATWRREKEYEDLTWQLAQRFPRLRAAFFKDLELRYAATENTSGLNKLAAAKLTYDAKDFRAQNDLAATSLLLRLNLPRAHELAKEAYSSHPEESIVAATYAYSLHVQRRTKEGLAILEKLKPEVRDAPPVVLYYAVLLATAGDTNRAAKYLEIAQRSHLLPEEKTLLAQTEKHL